MALNESFVNDNEIQILIITYCQTLTYVYMKSCIVNTYLIAWQATEEFSEGEYLRVRGEWLYVFCL